MRGRAYWLAQAYAQALECGYEAGHQIDSASGPEFDGFRVVLMIELPGGRQCTWHCVEHATPWDGHSTAEKYGRIHEWAREVMEGR